MKMNSVFSNIIGLSIPMHLEEYVHFIEDKCAKSMKMPKKTAKVSDDNTFVPTFAQYESVASTNYNVKQLRSMAKHYKLKLIGNKPQLVTRLFVFLSLSSQMVKIQKVFRGHLQRCYNASHGPAFLNRGLCTNATDFLTIEKVAALPATQFFSYQDVDGFIYGFDTISLYNLIMKSGPNSKNPYNRKAIPTAVVNSMRDMIRLSRILKVPIDIDIRDVNQDVTSKKSTELKILDIFQTIDSLGNYSDPVWFLSLTRPQMVTFIRQLRDIWEYRAQLPPETKRSICPPHGDPFRVAGFNLNLILSEPNMDNIRKMMCPLLETLVKTGIDRDSQSLGAYYVLAGLTLVNPAAANALPWLYQSVAYN
jgi:hypothetical protein